MRVHFATKAKKVGWSQRHVRCPNAPNSGPGRGMESHYAACDSFAWEGAMTGAMRDALELIRSLKEQYPDETEDQLI